MWYFKAGCHWQNSICTHVSFREQNSQRLRVYCRNENLLRVNTGTERAVVPCLGWCAKGWSVRFPLRTNPGREADANRERKWKTNDNWFVIGPKYLFPKFSSLLESGSLWVWKEELLGKKGRFAEEKTKGRGEGGGWEADRIPLRACVGVLDCRPRLFLWQVDRWYIIMMCMAVIRWRI